MNASYWKCHCKRPGSGDACRHDDALGCIACAALRRSALVPVAAPCGMSLCSHVVLFYLSYSKEKTRYSVYGGIRAESVSRSRAKRSCHHYMVSMEDDEEGALRGALGHGRHSCMGSMRSPRMPNTPFRPLHPVLYSWMSMKANGARSNNDKPPVAAPRPRCP